MLAQLEKPTNDFKALATYLIFGRERPPNRDRVAWTISRIEESQPPGVSRVSTTASWPSAARMIIREK